MNTTIWNPSEKSVDWRSRSGDAPDQSAVAADAVENMLRCPACHSGLLRQSDKLRCTKPDCEMDFPIVDGLPVLIHDDNSLFQRDVFTSRSHTTHAPRGKYSRWLDRWLPSLSRNLSTTKNFRSFAEILSKQSTRSIVLVIGGSVLGEGMADLASDQQIQLVETDVSFGSRTRVICDAHDLPFADDSFDGVIAQAVLQYVADPGRCVSEIERVLKPRGVVYAESAFMQQVVHGPYDFFRFTHLGLRRLFRRFDEVESGPVCGPGMALAWSCQFFLLSFATARWVRRIIYAAARLTLFWLKYFDGLLSKRPGTYDAASGFFFLGRKNGAILSDRELVGLYRGAQ